MKTSEVLSRAKELISKPENWTRAAFARDKDGTSVSWSSPDAVCFCSVGAVRRVAKEEGSEAETPLRLVMKSIVDYNDYRTHPEVLAAFDSAIGLSQEWENLNG